MNAIKKKADKRVIHTKIDDSFVEKKVDAHEMDLAFICFVTAKANSH